MEEPVEQHQAHDSASKHCDSHEQALVRTAAVHRKVCAGFCSVNYAISWSVFPRGAWNFLKISKVVVLRRVLRTNFKVPGQRNKKNSLVGTYTFMSLKTQKVAKITNRITATCHATLKILPKK